MEVATGLLVQLVAVLLKERLTKPIDGPQRSAQIVRDGIAERFKFLVLAIEILKQYRPRLGELGRGLGRCAADGSHFQVRAYAAEQLTGREWFDQIVVGSGFEPADNCFL